MYNTVKIAHDAKIFAQASIERVMKCGIGVCGSCCMSDAIVCSDGTIFDAKTLFANADFGHVYRDKSGIPTKY